MKKRIQTLLLLAILAFNISAFSAQDYEVIPKQEIIPVNRNTGFRIYRPMVDLDLVEWIHWFGPTVFSFEEGDFWDYTEYCQGQHCGLDLGAPWGTPLYSGIFGEVKFVSNERIEIWHNENTERGWWKIVYLNIADIYVKAGDFVTPNTLIGTIGNHINDPYVGGIYTDHLHFEVRFDPNPYEIFKSEHHNPLFFFYDENIYEKLNQIALRQYDTRDWYYMRDALLMGIDSPLDVRIILREPGVMAKSWISWQGNRHDYIDKYYYIENFPGPILGP